MVCIWGFALPDTPLGTYSAFLYILVELKVDTNLQCSGKGHNFEGRKAAKWRLCFAAGEARELKDMERWRGNEVTLCI